MKRLLLSVTLLFVLLFAFSGMGANAQEDSPPATPTAPPTATPVPPVEGDKIVIGTLSAGLLAAIAGAVLSLLFSYVPGLSDKFAALDGVYKRLVMLLLLAVVSGAIYGGICAGVFEANVTCGRGGLLTAIALFIEAVIANQTAFVLTGKN